jgi:methionyl-tRNA formyltransferase
MKIDVLCSNEHHPVNSCLRAWVKERATQYEVALLHDKNQLISGDILFLVSCTELISKSIRNSYSHCIVLHASDLPEGRGWSPLVWSILEGKATITVSALDAEDHVDSGAIWAKMDVNIAPHELHDEINESLFRTEIALLDIVMTMVQRGETPSPQPETAASYYPRRAPADSELDPERSLVEQFNKIRVCDPERYPAFFRLHGHTYSITLRKVPIDD